ncbi:amino acid ABC transporter permease [Candidatus Haliotispira prima]|uniref:Amino acid ABC transporter permease n=1 Tax=Candidatus Haliotispira prima TaxID=3034016 RepID=A0ABY8MJM8_9SPIO|nr:amino acid ABC transporter permease [Candidatus Haliotispira prima]
MVWERSRPALSFLLELVLVIGIFLCFSSLAVSRLPIAIQWQRIPGYFVTWSGTEGWLTGPFFQGLKQTLRLSATALGLTLLIGYFTALLRISRVPSARLLAQFYIQIVRNTPLLVQLYVSYFLLSPLLGLTSFQTALLVLSLFEGAYTAEIIRNAIENIPPGQSRAAHALGLSTMQVKLLVVHPQALRNALPILANQGVSLIKDSALASAIGVFELSRSAQSIQEKTFLPFEPWLGVCAIYFIITFSLSMLIKSLERRTSQGRN